MTAKVGIDAAALEPLEREELHDLIDPLLSRLGVKPTDMLAVTITPAHVSLRLKLRGDRGHMVPYAWARVQVLVIESDPKP